jgi:hypothetical protein
VVGDRSNSIVDYKLIDYLAERVRPPWRWTDLYKPDHRISMPVMQAGLSMVVWILKREKLVSHRYVIGEVHYYPYHFFCVTEGALT